jgi:hypothetical protein
MFSPATRSQIKPEPLAILPLNFTPATHPSLIQFLSDIPDYAVVDLPAGTIKEELFLRRPVYLIGNNTTLIGLGIRAVIECSTTGVIENVTITSVEKEFGVFVTFGGLRLVKCLLTGGEVPMATVGGFGFLDIDSVK